MQFSTPEIDETTAYMWNILTGEQHALFEQYSSKAFQVEEYDWHKTPLNGPILTGKTSWKRLDASEEPIHFKGRLIGGCLETISRLAGTCYGNLPQFCEQYEQDGVILYFEYSELQPCELLRTLTSLKMHGWFKRLTGILVGRAVPNLDNEPSKLNDLDVLQAVLSDLNIPVLYDVDLGHVPPQMSFLNGALAQISFYNQGGKMSLIKN